MFGLFAYGAGDATLVKLSEVNFGLRKLLVFVLPSKSLSDAAVKAVANISGGNTTLDWAIIFASFYKVSTCTFCRGNQFPLPTG